VIDILYKLLSALILILGPSANVSWLLHKSSWVWRGVFFLASMFFWCIGAAVIYMIFLATNSHENVVGNLTLSNIYFVLAHGVLGAAFIYFRFGSDIKAKI
jgi:hypothetical protein